MIKIYHTLVKTYQTIKNLDIEITHRVETNTYWIDTYGEKMHGQKTFDHELNSLL